MTTNWGASPNPDQLISIACYLCKTNIQGRFVDQKVDIICDKCHTTLVDTARITKQKSVKVVIDMLMHISSEKEKPKGSVMPSAIAL